MTEGPFSERFEDPACQGVLPTNPKTPGANILARIGDSMEELKEENEKLRGTIARLRGENLESHKQIKNELGLRIINFNPGPKDEEGNFTILIDNVVQTIPQLKAKDVLNYSAFRKKVLGLTGKVLPNVDKTAWELFLQDNIQ